MNWLQTTSLLVLTFMAVFIQGTWDLPHSWLGAQLSLLPSLVVYAAIQTDVVTLALVSVLGGLWADSLSANPFGLSILPLFWLGFMLHRWRDLLLRELTYAQCVMGIMAGVAVPLLTLLLLLSMGAHPLLGGWSLWQLGVLGVAGGCLTPPTFWLMERLVATFSYQPVKATPFRADREIKRGRH